MLTGKKILVMEDSPTIKHHLRLIFKDTRVKLVEAGSEFGMFNSIEEYGVMVDLIIMDLHLKYENGLNLIKKLKSNPKYNHIPIIIITEDASKEHVIKARKLGVKDFIRKPIKKEALLERVSNILTISIKETLVDADTIIAPE